MSDLLAIGASGVRAYQSAIGTVSENIANAGNAAYARRTATLKEIGTAGGMTRSGSGVMVTGIARAADAFKSASIRSAGADLAKTQSGAVWLDSIDTSLTGNQLGARITGFFNAATTLAADPQSMAARATMLEQASTVATGFTATGAALAQAAVDLDATADQATTQLGALGAALTKVNDGFARVGTGSAAAASLADQRDQLLEQMSALTDVAVATDAIGRVTVRAGGGSGPVLVAPGTESAQITYVRNAQGATSFAVYREGAVASLSPNGGALAGIADGASRIAGARATLDDLATRFVAGVNAVQAGGEDLAGAAGAAIFAADARDPTAITMTLGDPAGIAAASPGGGARDNRNLAALASLRSAGGFETGLTSAVADNAATIASRKTVAEAQAAIRDGAVTARDAVTGVDLDTEAVDLLRFQQAYQASSRIIQVAKDTFQSILEIR